VIRDIAIKSLSKDGILQEKYDHMLATVGYESRCVSIPSAMFQNSTEKCAIGFTHHKCLAYSANKDWFTSNNFILKEFQDAEFAIFLDEFCNQISNNSKDIIRVCIDISSMTRFRIASIFWKLFSLNNNKVLMVDFVYCIAEFNKPCIEDNPIITNAGAVIKEFAGWPDDPTLPTSAILGLGYEYNKALGALEYIEPVEAWAFSPVSPDSRYDLDLANANKSLLSMIPKNKVLSYNLLRAVETVFNLESLIYGTLKNTRPVIVPFGPKIFTLYALLVAAFHYPKIAVWRVSSGEYIDPVDRKGSDEFLGLSVKLTPPREKE